MNQTAKLIRVTSGQEYLWIVRLLKQVGILTRGSHPMSAYQIHAQHHGLYIRNEARHDGNLNYTTDLPLNTSYIKAKELKKRLEEQLGEEFLE